MPAYIAPCFFLILWCLHTWLVDISPWRTKTLTYAMNQQRNAWMHTMAQRELRIIDTNIIGGLQSGTAFFASTSLLAIGAAFTLLNSSAQILNISSSLPVQFQLDQTSLEVKAMGLMILYAYAFLKFGWAYRLFNYTSILIGTVPMPQEEKATRTTETTQKASRMNIAAAQEFNRGQRAFFIAIGYLGWFFGDLIFMVSSLIVFTMMFIRQFNSSARSALIDVE